LSVVLVNPRGNYPLNDDWLYARSVETFLSEGRIVKPQLAAVSLVFQTLWGAGFCSIFGFSHTVLRVSNLLLHLAAALALAVVVLLRTGKCSLGVFVGLTLIFSPLALLSAFSFMWEPALVAMIAFSLLALYSWERNHHWRAGVSLWFFSMAAVLVHPVAIVVPGWLVVRWLGRNGGFIRRAWPGIWALMAGTVFLWWHLADSSTETMTGFWVGRGFAVDVPFRVFVRLPGAILYLGLFLLPVGMSLFSAKRVLVALPFFAWAWGQGIWAGGAHPFPLPCLENTLTLSGIGFLGLQGYQPTLGAPFWWAISVLAALSALGLMGRLNWWERVPIWAMLLLACLPWAARLTLGPSLLRAAIGGLVGLVAWAVFLWPTLRERGAVALGLVWLLLFVALPPFYDRYLVVLLPLFLVGFVRSMARPLLVGWMAVFLIAAGSIAGVHDYLAVNRTRWDLLHDLTALKGIDPSAIDGGYEWAGWHYAWQGIPARERLESARGPWWTTLWAPQIQPEYVVSLSPLPGMTAKEVRSCPTIDERWRVYLLRPTDVSSGERE
jgi:hypothetical protein